MPMTKAEAVKNGLSQTQADQVESACKAKGFDPSVWFKLLTDAVTGAGLPALFADVMAIIASFTTPPAPTPTP